MLRQRNFFEAWAIIRLIIANDVLDQFSLPHFLSSKSSFPPSHLKSGQSDEAVFNYFLLEIVNPFNKAVKVVSCVMYCLIFLILPTISRGHQKQ